MYWLYKSIIRKKTEIYFFIVFPVFTNYSIYLIYKCSAYNCGWYV